MRITVSHNKTKEEVMQSVDRAVNELFKGSLPLPVKLVEKQREWNGSTLTFALSARMGFLNTPIKGTVEVTDHDLTIDADLGMLERMIPADKARDVISSRLKGLLT